MKTVYQRFEEKFIPEALTGCWLWTAAQQKNGYGHIQFKGSVTLAHRVSYELYVGEIPDGMCVLHNCDTPQCVNPYHLFLGTQKDNMMDKKIKGRAECPDRIGELSWSSKLKKEQVLSIIEDKRSHRKIAKDYGVGKTTIGYIKSGVTWSKYLRRTA